jgi:hypothetical protein
VLGIALLGALAFLFERGVPWNDHVLAKHAANAAQQKTTVSSKASRGLTTTPASRPADSLGSPRIVETGGGNAETTQPGDSRRGQDFLIGASSRNSQTLEKASDASEGSSVPVEPSPKREKP